MPDTDLRGAVLRSDYSALYYARRTGRLQDLVRHLGLALGGRPAQALAVRLLLPVSKDTFLRGICNAMSPPASAPRVIGTNDSAWRRGQHYGTVICAGRSSICCRTGSRPL